MKIEELLNILKQCACDSEKDPELAHLEADIALIKYINNIKVDEAYQSIVKGYEN